MQIVRDLAGYSYGRSDLVRRAMSKKKHDVMLKERENFIHGIVDETGNIIVKGAVRNGVDERTANRIFDQMMDFASYAFNKSHAAAYAVVAYQTAWLKLYYPVEFMAASLNSFLGSSSKVSYYVHECKHAGIEVLPPDVNESDIRFTVVNGKIRFGMAAVKNVGENAVRELIQERSEGGPFTSFGDFCERIGGRDFNKRCVESLIKCGAFDSLGVYRSRMMAVYERLLDSAQQNKKSKVEGQLSLFEFPGRAQTIKLEEHYPELKEFSAKMLLAMEKEMLGLYVSGHPLKEFEEEILEQATINSSDLNAAGIEEAGGSMAEAGSKSISDGIMVTVGGIITEIKAKTTKSNNLMAFVTIEDLYGSMEVIVFPAVLKRFKELLVNENAVFIDGRISIKEEEQPKILCDSVRMIQKKNAGAQAGIDKAAALINGKKGHDAKVYIKTNAAADSEMMRSVISLLQYFNGTTPVIFCSSDSVGNVSRSKIGEYRAELCETLQRELIERFGEDNVKIVSKPVQKQ